MSRPGFFFNELYLSLIAFSCSFVVGATSVEVSECARTDSGTALRLTNVELSIEIDRYLSIYLNLPLSTLSVYHLYLSISEWSRRE